MKEIVLKQLQHRGMECIGICFEINFSNQGLLQKTGVVKFSITENCWYTPLCRENYNKLCFVLKGLQSLRNLPCTVTWRIKGKKPAV